MKGTLAIFCLWIVGLQCCLAVPAPAETISDNLLEASEKFGAPLIIPTEPDITLDVGTNFTLTCTSKNRVTWRIPEIHTEFEHQITHFDDSGSKLHRSSLYLYDAKVQNVGKYYCIETEFNSTEDSDLEILITLYRAETIYIYVNDPHHLLVPTVTVVMAKQYADTIIPCKPSSKDVKVELLRGDEIPYDPKVGFKLSRALENDKFQCKLTHKEFPEKSEENHFYLEVQPHMEYIDRPIITSLTNGHAIEGGLLTLECSIDIRPAVQFSINWTLPNVNAAVNEGRVTVTDTIKILNPQTAEMEIGRNKLIVRDVSEKDTGYYQCDVLDHSGNKNKDFIFVKILRHDESYINMSEASNHYRIETTVKKRRVKMFVKYKAYPQPVFTWYNGKGEEIKPSEKYNISQTSESILLEIRTIDFTDTGEYILKAQNDNVEKELKFELFVKDKPIVKMEEVYYVHKGAEVMLVCECAGYPKSQITWTWTPCQIKPKWPSCFPASASKFEFKEIIVPEDSDHLEELENNSYLTTELSIVLQRSELKFTPVQPGFVMCSAKNSEASDTFNSTILLGDLNEPFTIFGVEDNHIIAAGDDVSITCGVLAYNYSANIDWFKNDSLLDTNLDWQIQYSESEYSYKKKLILRNIGYDKSGLYECRANLIDDDASPESRFINITVHEPKAPTITHSNLEGSQIGKKLGEVLSLECQYKGIPEPVISWYKDDVRIVPSKNDSRRLLGNRNSTLSITFIKPEDEGNYKCVVSNRLGSVEKHAAVSISNLPGLRLMHILIIVAMFIVLILLIIYLFIRYGREKKLRKELKAAGLANFEEGALECINPALSVDEQADLLPYDPRFEFPKEKLKLGKQLGAGAFGVVLKAVAAGIVPEEKETTVAVKMVKKTADNEVMRALVSELKIMVHLGQHLNVVNLLGAVTKNIAKREVMLIVEYCRFGNVQNFLLKNRKNFINQINQKTDQIDPSIVTRFSGNYEYNSKNEGDMSTNYIRQSGGPDYAGANMNSAATEMTTIPGDETIILSNNSVQPVWRSNYRPDGSTNMDITTTHLLSWAFQIARGMDYLASRGVLHGDLAARNILLCEENIVKICDFGLARSIYKSGNYKKHSDSPVPIKWLALESMSDQVFNTFTDVWSYGIVLWELFSLGKVPYPGMDADETLYLKLKDGYRMEKPEYSNQELYDIMLECWSTNPDMRPSFSELERKFARMLGDDITNHYIDLNDPYLKMNSEFYKNGKTDFLTLMGIPEEIAPPAPRYVNGNLIANMAANASPDAEYVQMHPNTEKAIFSPRPDNYVRADHFSFPTPISPTISNNLDSPSAKNRKKGAIPEEVPMLKRGPGNTGSDSETELTPDAISSPSKQFSSLNKVPDSNKNVTDNDKYLSAQSSDMNRLRTKDAFSNPEYLILNDVNEKRT